MDRFSSPISEYENSPINFSNYRHESLFYEEVYNMKEVGNLKEYYYFVSLLNQNFSFKDFAILKITDENIKLAVVPKENREKYSKYFFDPTENILNLEENIMNKIFKNHSLKFQISPKNVIFEENEEKSSSLKNNTNNNNKVKRKESNDSEKSKTSIKSSIKRNSSSTNESYSSKVKSNNNSTSKKDNNINSSDKNLSNDIESESSSLENSTTTLNSNNDTENYNWDLEDLGNPSDLIILDIEKLF
eukprot:jgi/Orpsp1_1/1174484/evm.model.c7180000050308.1